jgi:hypothetical protein
LGSLGLSTLSVLAWTLSQPPKLEQPPDWYPRTIVMDEGQVVADGLTMEILDYEELLTMHGLEKPSSV